MKLLIYLLMGVFVASCNNKKCEENNDSINHMQLELVNSQSEIQRLERTIYNLRETYEKNVNVCPENKRIKHQFKNGSEVWLCFPDYGVRPTKFLVDKFIGSVFFKAPGKDVVAIGNYGGVYENVDELSVIYYAIKFKENTFMLSELMPYRRREKVPSVFKEYKCDRDKMQCNVIKTHCAFKSKNNKKKSAAIEKIIDFNNGKNKWPGNYEAYFEAFYDALDGNKRAQEFFIKSKELPKPKAFSFDYHSGHNEVYRAAHKFIQILKENNCI